MINDETFKVMDRLCDEVLSTEAPYIRVLLTIGACDDPDSPGVEIDFRSVDLLAMPHEALRKVAIGRTVVEALRNQGLPGFSDYRVTGSSIRLKDEADGVETKMITFGDDGDVTAGPTEVDL